MQVILWGDEQPIAAGLLLVTDRHVRFWPSWSGFGALTHAAGSARSTSEPLVIGRSEVTSMGWVKVSFFLRGLRLALRDGHELVR